MKITKYVLLITLLGSMCSSKFSNNILHQTFTARRSGTIPLPPPMSGIIPRAPPMRGPGGPQTGLVLGSNRSNVADSSPKKKYKIINWDKIDVISDSLWEKIKQEDLPQVDDAFYELFEDQLPKKEEKRTDLPNTNSEPKQEKPSFMNDSNKAIVWGLLAKKSPKVDPTLIEAFNKMDNNLLNSNTLESLVANYINLDEDRTYKDAVAKYIKENPNIKEIDIKWRDEPDSFFVDLHRKIKNFKSKGKLWLLLLNFSDSKEPMKESIENIDSVLEEIKDNKRIPQLLTYILKIGNFLNQNNNRVANAKGFHLKVVPLISLVKAKDRKSMLYHVVRLIKTSDSTFEGLKPTFPKLLKKKLDFEEVEIQFNNFKKTFIDTQDAMKILKEVSGSTVVEGDSFLTKANESFNEFENFYNEINTRFSSLQAKFESTLKYLGYNPSKQESDKKLFANINDIINTVDKEYAAFSIDSKVRKPKK